MQEAIKETKKQLAYMTKRIGKKRAENLLIDILNRYYDEEYEQTPLHHQLR